MLSDILLNRIASDLHSFPKLKGTQVAFLDKVGISHLINKGDVCLQNYHDFYIVIEDISAKILPTSPTPVVTPIERNDSKLMPEFIGALIGCSQFGLSIAGASAVTVFTGGFGVVMGLAASASIVTSALQCWNGIRRVIEIQSSPNSNSLHNWDNNPHYKGFWERVDMMNVAAGVTQLGSPILLILKNKAMLKWESGQIPTKEAVVAAMNRIKDDKELKDALLKHRIVSNATIDGSRKVYQKKAAIRIISEIQEQLNKKLKNIVGSEDFRVGLAGLGFNSMPSNWVGSASGTLSNWRESLFTSSNQVKLDTLAIPLAKQPTYVSTFIIHIIEK
jgi:hypothetical protein